MTDKRANELYKLATLYPEWRIYIKISMIKKPKMSLIKVRLYYDMSVLLEVACGWELLLQKTLVWGTWSDILDRVIRWGSKVVGT